MAYDHLAGLDATTNLFFPALQAAQDARYAPKSTQNIAELGAVEGGVVDNTTIIQNALNAAGNLGTLRPHMQNPTGTPTFKGGGRVYVPAGIWLTGPLSIPSGVTLEGDGWGTILKLKAASNAPIITNASHSILGCLRKIRLWGNAAAQTVATNAHGVSIVNTGTYNATLDEDYDTTFTIEDVFVWDVAGSGFVTQGRGNIKIVNCKAYYCRGGNGFKLDQDVFVSGSETGWSGLEGFYIYGSGGNTINCKSWYCGQVSGGHGYHLYFINDHTLSGCSAQDNLMSGVFIEGCTGVVVSGVTADSNNTGGTSQSGFLLWQSSNNIVDGSSVDNARNTNVQDSAVRLGGTCVSNTIKLVSKGNTNGHISSSSSASDLTTNKIVINSQEGMQTVAYAASITPNPYNGGTISIPLTGAITLANPAAGHLGLKMTFILTQDATGGRVTTFGSAYKVNFTPVTTANKINIISFIYDGTNWIQQSTSTI